MNQRDDDFQGGEVYILVYIATVGNDESICFVDYRGEDDGVLLPGVYIAGKIYQRYERTRRYFDVLKGSGDYLETMRVLMRPEGVNIELLDA